MGVVSRRPACVVRPQVHAAPPVQLSLHTAPHAMSTSDTLTNPPAPGHSRAISSQDEHVTPGDLAVGVIVGRISQSFDVFVFDMIDKKLIHII